jgi:hypothetical protein
MAPDSVETAAVETAMEATTVEIVSVKSVMKIAIVESMMETAAKETVEADDAIGPAIVPIGIIPGIRIVSGDGRNTVRRGRLRSSGRFRSKRAVKSIRSGRGWRRGRRTFFRRGGVRRRRGANNGRWRARHKLIAVCWDRLVRATRKLRRSNHCDDRGQKMTVTHEHLVYDAPCELATIKFLQILLRRLHARDMSALTR